MSSGSIIRLAYGVMIVGMVLSFILSRNHKKNLRKTADQFALAFVRLSNDICPKTPPSGLLAEALDTGAILPRPLSEQPQAIRTAAERAMKEKSIKLFAQMDGAAAKLAEEVGKNRRLKSQFSEPVDQILMLTHTFLEGCENLTTVNTTEKLEQFDSFLLEQVKHRMVLLRRISGATAEEYRQLNRRYAREMEEMEQAQRAAGQQKPAQSPESEKTQRREGPQSSSSQQETGQSGTDGDGAEADPQEHPANPIEKGDWQGWGCG